MDNKYHLKIIAVDDSSLKGELDVTIEILDINDTPTLIVQNVTQGNNIVVKWENAGVNEKDWIGIFDSNYVVIVWTYRAL